MSAKYKLHSRIARKILYMAAIASILYSVFVVTLVNRLEVLMVTTLLGHEVSEMVIELQNDPDIPMPKSASIQAFRLSEEDIYPIPQYLKNLDYDGYVKVQSGDRSHHATVVDLFNDRIYISFDTTDINKTLSLLELILIGGGIIFVIMLFASWFWLTKKFVVPVSTLAEEVATLDPNIRNIRLEEGYKDYEVGIIAQSFDQFLVRMDEFVEREQSFSAAVSHELRTPVSVIATALDLLELDGVTEQQQGVINRIRASTNYMHKMIESLLFFARNADEKFEPTLTEINLETVFEETLAQYKGQAKIKKLELLLEVEYDKKVRIIENHIQIILGNLIQNAINNTTVGSIKVVLQKDKFCVIDTGHGIGSNEIDLVLERCYHGPESNGCGLGLYLVMKVCKVHGLDLKIDSQLGQGSSFCVIFPQQAEAI
jgi:signal transduction histidine kinase